jgi:Tol biopolymer transport system component
MRRVLVLVAVLVVAVAVVAGVAVAATAGAAESVWKVAWAADDTQGVRVLVSGRKGSRRLGGGRVEDVVWSPDGTLVAYVQGGAVRGVYIVALAGSKPRRLTSMRADAVSWSPDGSWLAVSSDCVGNCRRGVFVVSARGGKDRLVHDAGTGYSGCGSASWSPDGTRIVVWCEGEIWSVMADGSGGERVADGDVSDPSWSPGGSLVAFGRRCYGPPAHGGDVYCDVAVMRPDGTGKRTLVRHQRLSGPQSGPPVWSPEGNLLIDEWGYKHDVRMVNPVTGAARRVYPDTGWNLTAGPDGTFALMTTAGYGKPLTLDIVSATGKRLLRHRLPFEFSDPASIWLG